MIGFYADIAADALSLPECANPTQAYSVLEALRIGATRILDMHMEDLQILVIGEIGNEAVQGLLWDPMPGGSGLLERLRERFAEVVEVAREVVEGCEGACESSCIDCLQTFRNSYYHNRLDRTVALDALKEWGRGLTCPARHPAERTCVLAVRGCGSGQPGRNEAASSAPAGRFRGRSSWRTDSSGRRAGDHDAGRHLP